MGATRRLLGLAIPLLTLAGFAGCSSQHAGSAQTAPGSAATSTASPGDAWASDQAKDSGQDAKGGYGTYSAVDANGTVFTVTIAKTGDAHNTVGQDLRAYQKLAGDTRPLVFVTEAIDNTRGTGPTDGADLRLVAGGKSYDLTDASYYVTDHVNDPEYLAPAANTDAANQLVDRINSSYPSDQILPGTKATETMVFVGAAIPAPTAAYANDQPMGHSH